ncbi:MAG TPA: Ger(x)C family spore germination protein [Candidatus Deferrimicrobium sp.]|nr:Ger(x)C family spore germination protein [Candidatus Deferrimicrobium sp.]
MKCRLSRVGVLFLVCVLLLSTGCWDQVDVANLDIVKVLTVDLISENGSDKWEMGVLVFKPSGKTGGEQGQSKTFAPEIPWRATGLTMEEAIIDFSKRSPRFPFFSHTNVIIIGERTAKERTKDVIELAERYRETRPNCFIMVTKDEAYKLTETEPEVGITNSEEIKAMAEITAQPLGLTVRTPLGEFGALLLSPDRDAVASRINLIHTTEKRGEKLAGPAKTTTLEGMGVFSNQKLVGWFDLEETRGYLFITQKNTGLIKIPMQRNGKEFTFVVRRTKPKLVTKLVGEKLTVNLKITAEGSVIEGNGMHLDDEGVKEVEEIATQRIKGMVQSTIARAKEYNSDCLGFSQNLHRWHVADWEKIKDNWREAYVNADVNVQVEVDLSDTGHLSQGF